MSRAQRSVSIANGALQNRDRCKLGVNNGPGSAVHRFALHRIRETRLNLAPMARPLCPARGTVVGAHKGRPYGHRDKDETLDNSP